MLIYLCTRTHIFVYIEGQLDFVFPAGRTLHPSPVHPCSGPVEELTRGQLLGLLVGTVFDDRINFCLLSETCFSRIQGLFWGHVKLILWLYFGPCEGCLKALGMRLGGRLGFLGALFGGQRSQTP